MLWFKKQAESPGPGRRDVIEPGSLGIGLDAEIFGAKLESLMSALYDKGGVDPFLEALGKKQALFSTALEASMLDDLDERGFDALLECVFSARRKLPKSIHKVDLGQRVVAVKALVYGEDELPQRMAAFRDLAGDDPKARRAAWDFAAELLHFNDPAAYPLMSRWVWDANTQSGAMREFIRHNDALPDIPIPATPAAFEAGRVWMAEQLNERGFYRELPFLIDLVLAQAYADYMFAMSRGMGMMGSDFGGQSEPLELVVKLLGIEPERPSGKSRLKKETLH